MPISKKTGNKYAAGSQKKYGGWEPRTCYHCGQRLTLARHAGMHSNPEHGFPFTLCNDHINHYSEAYADMGPATDVDHADRIHPDQLEIE